MSTAENQKEEAEKEALKALRNIRNHLLLEPESRPSSLPNGDFDEWWDVAANALLRLGAHEKDIKLIRTCTILQNAQGLSAATAVNQDNESKSKVLRAEAKKLLTTRQVEDGLQRYAQALLFSGLSPAETCRLHSSRSQVILAMLEDQTVDWRLADDGPIATQNRMDIAMDDAKLVIQLEPESSAGYFLEGKFFQLQKRFKEAIDSFELALTLNPDTQDILTANARLECIIDQSDIQQQVLSDLVYIPTRLSELIQSREKVQQLVQDHLGMMISRDPAKRVRGLLFMGHRHQLGDEAPLNLKRANELFWEAAQEGSPEGAYYTALNILTGTGARRTIGNAVRLIQTAANKPMEAGSKHYQLHNDAVARAVAALGLLYENGLVGGSRNYAQAAQWYKCAAAEGIGAAGMNFARILSLGLGMAQDFDTALQYQKLAVELGSGGFAGMHFLGRIYAELGDLSQARYWSTRALTSGYAPPPQERHELEELLQYKEERFQEFRNKLPAHVLSSKVPIHTLHKRYVKRINSSVSDIEDVVRDLRQSLVSSVFSDPVVRAEPNPTEVGQFAADGQGYARLLQEPLETINNLLLSNHAGPVVGDDPPSQNARDLKRTLALTVIAACCKVGMDPAATMSTRCRSKLMEVSEEFIQDGRRSDSDLAARVCRLNLLMSSADEALLKYAKECQLLYPEEAHFYERHSYVLGLLEKHKEGLEVAEEALKIFPNNWEIIFTRARHLCQLIKPRHNEEAQGEENGQPSRGNLLQDESDGEMSEDDLLLPSKLNNGIEAYQEFLRSAPSGHPNIPEAYYRLANLYELSGNFQESEAQLIAGIEAEKCLLSHFLPYVSSAKEVAEQTREKTLELRAQYQAVANVILGSLSEKEEKEIKETRAMKLCHPKRAFIVKEYRRRILSRVGEHWDERSVIESAGFIRSRLAVAGRHKELSPTPKGTPSLIMSPSLKFEDMDPTIDKLYGGRVIDLTIVEEYIKERVDPIETVVKDDNDDFNLIHLYNFDKSDPTLTQSLGYGSRIRLMNPHLTPSEFGRPAVIRVDDPRSVLFLSSGEENPMCRYCWEPVSGLRCAKCKTARYCNRECQKMDWEDLGHKDLCKALRQHQKHTSGNC